MEGSALSFPAVCPERVNADKQTADNPAGHTSYCGHCPPTGRLCDVQCIRVASTALRAFCKFASPLTDVSGAQNRTDVARTSFNRKRRYRAVHHSALTTGPRLATIDPRRRIPLQCSISRIISDTLCYRQQGGQFAFSARMFDTRVGHCVGNRRLRTPRYPLCTSTWLNGDNCYIYIVTLARSTSKFAAASYHFLSMSVDQPIPVAILC